LRSPLVSTCIPTYNQTEYLRKCLQSVIEQDFIDYELIITDDTPDDSVKELVFTMLDGRDFKYIKNCPSLGSPANWNKAISEANGTYIKILHHDDFFLYSNSLRLMVDQVINEDADFLFCETKVWFPETDSSRIHTISDEQLENVQRHVDTLFFNNWIGSPSATLFRYDPVLSFDERLVWLVDVDFYLNYLRKHKKIVFMRSALICTAHGMKDQITTSVENNRLIQVKEPVLVFTKNCLEFMSDRNYKTFFEDLFNRYNVSSYDELHDIVSDKEGNESYFIRFFAFEMSASGIFRYISRKVKYILAISGRLGKQWNR